MGMVIAKSRITSQGQISVPAEVRRRLGLAPGSFIEWDQLDGLLVVRKVGGNESMDVHAALFEGAPVARANRTVSGGISDYMRRKHARD